MERRPFGATELNPLRDHGSALHLGITGHRPNKLPAATRPALDEAVRTLLGDIDRSVRAMANSPNHVGGRGTIWLVSGLAEGADRLVVEQAPVGWKLFAMLPMPVADYEEDFTTDIGLAQFRTMLAAATRVQALPPLEGTAVPTGSGRDRQYEALGSALVRQIDLLLAIWDGKPAAGPGGTETVIREATARGVPVILVDPAHPDPPRLLDVAGRADADELDGSGLSRLLEGLARPPRDESRSA